MFGGIDPRSLLKKNKTVAGSSPPAAEDNTEEQSQPQPHPRQRMPVMEASTSRGDGDRGEGSLQAYYIQAKWIVLVHMR